MRGPFKEVYWSRRLGRWWWAAGRIWVLDYGLSLLRFPNSRDIDDLSAPAITASVCRLEVTFGKKRTGSCVQIASECNRFADILAGAVVDLNEFNFAGTLQRAVE